MKTRRSLKPAGETKQKPKAKSLIEMERKMGKTLVDFANASNANEAVYGLIDNMKLAFNLSDDYVNNMKSNISQVMDGPHSMRNRFSEIQQDIREILDRLLHEKDLRGFKGFEFLLRGYNLGNKHIVTFKENGSLIKIPSFDEKSYELTRERAGTFGVLVDALSYCLVDFILPKTNIKYLAKCIYEYCHKYFIATRLNNQKFCGSSCRMKHHHSKPEYREKKAAAQREKYGWEKSVNAD